MSKCCQQLQAQEQTFVETMTVRRGGAEAAMLTEAQTWFSSSTLFPLMLSRTRQLVVPSGLLGLAEPGTLTGREAVLSPSQGIPNATKKLLKVLKGARAVGGLWGGCGGAPSAAARL